MATAGSKKGWRCPICRAPVQRDEREFPFCSRRCRAVDLGNWATEKYVIHAPVLDPEAFGEAEGTPEKDQDEQA